MEERERNLIIEFCHLLEKSKQLFNGLRDLPQYGHKHWHTYFGRTFDVYTKLWKFQQCHRLVLDTKYGLKRWQIGEIASKIGQLYYHFYLRTSDTSYLLESCAFYQAIRSRSYYTKACEEDTSELIIKKMRYYARFIVVALLLKRKVLVNELVVELDWQVKEYGSTYSVEDQIDWISVIREAKAFLLADSVVEIYQELDPIVVNYRSYDYNIRPFDRTSSMTLRLHESLIVGCVFNQVKYSELTVDMYRIIHTMEREPRYYRTHDGPIPHNGYRGMRENPHKYLLFKPTLNQLLVYLSNGVKELPSNGALLLYISADGCFPSDKVQSDPYDVGGVATFTKYNSPQVSSRDVNERILPMHCFYPSDILPFTRKPLFIIIDSDNSTAFKHIPRLFGQPLIILMSPIDLPNPFKDLKSKGNLFTLFLHSPLAAFCITCDIHHMSAREWNSCQIYLDYFMSEATKLILSSPIDPTYIKFFGDNFLRMLILRYIFCEVVLRSHRSFRSRNCKPSCMPPMPEAELLDNITLINIVYDLALHIREEERFFEPPTKAEIGAMHAQSSTSQQQPVMQQPTSSHHSAPPKDTIIYKEPKDSICKEQKEMDRHGPVG